MHDWQSLSHVRWEWQRGIGLLEAHAMPDHVHLCLSIPPKYSVAHANRVSERKERGSNPSGVTYVPFSSLEH
jgi:REP element-mobilizing transposase RayT